MSVRRVESSDGTGIAVHVSGSGTPVVIVPGTLAPAVRYRPLVDILSEDHQVLLVERRGYGDTPSGPRPCRTGLQVQDLTAVLASSTEPPAVFGHSLGGIIALSALSATASVVKNLVLYEPPVALLGGRMAPIHDRCRALLAAGDAEGAVMSSFEVSGSPSLQEERAAKQAAARLRAQAQGLLVDLECVTSMTVDDIMPAEHWAALDAPVTLIGAGLSGPEYRESVRMLRRRIPTADYFFRPDEEHFPRDMRFIASLVSSA